MKSPLAKRVFTIHGIHSRGLTLSVPSNDNADVNDKRNHCGGRTKGSPFAKGELAPVRTLVTEGIPPVGVPGMSFKKRAWVLDQPLDSLSRLRQQLPFAKGEPSPVHRGPFIAPDASSFPAEAP